MAYSFRQLLLFSPKHDQSALEMSPLIQGVLTLIQGLSRPSYYQASLAFSPGQVVTRIGGYAGVASEAGAQAERQPLSFGLRIDVGSDVAAEMVLEDLRANLAVIVSDPKYPYRAALAASPAIASSDFGGLSVLGTRAQALRAIGADALAQRGLFGAGVNVVVVDQGFDKNLFPGLDFGGGWTLDKLNPVTGGPAGTVPPPGEGSSAHTAMIVRNILALAPKATLWDCAVIRKEPPGEPTAPGNVCNFIDEASGVWTKMLAEIGTDILKTKAPWVLVNPWAIYDRRTEVPAGAYTENRAHPFNRLVEQAEVAGIDVVFAAGNCGLHAPDPRCGEHDRAPGTSIFGANSHSSSLSVGAMLLTGDNLSFSSEGPGQVDLAVRKPDLCAPSQFCDDGDARCRNTGTSAASAVAAGVVAALRTQVADASAPGPATTAAASTDHVPPAALHRILWETARPIRQNSWRPGRGYGMIDAGNALADKRLASP